MLSKETIPRHFYMPIIQAAKEPNLGPTPLKKRCREPDPRLAPLEEKVQRAGSGGASIEPRLRQSRRRWWRKTLLLTRQESDATSTCFGFWLKEVEISSPSYQNGRSSWVCVYLVQTTSPWASEGPGASAEGVVSSPLHVPQAYCTKGGKR